MWNDLLICKRIQILTCIREVLRKVLPQKWHLMSMWASYFYCQRRWQEVWKRARALLGLFGLCLCEQATFGSVERRSRGWLRGRTSCSVQKTDERLIASQNPNGSNDFFVVLGRSLCRFGDSESFDSGSIISTFCVCNWPRTKYNRPRKVCRGILSWFCWSWIMINLINVFLSCVSNLSFSAFSSASRCVFASSESITDFQISLDLLTSYALSLHAVRNVCWNP